MPATGPRYTATFEWAEDGLWVVSLAEEPNVVGYGDTLANARRNIRDAITAVLGPFGSEGAVFELVEDVRLPTELLDMVSLARRQRQRASRQ
ncbi:MAG: type II toxin-antitoxin system HicB family antitoxin, partial [Actinobacteria bacterium]|nr:type II toxin-antitoxin system HicB family antitoxin [Actinomycetota bacterium]